MDDLDFDPPHAPSYLVELDARLSAAPAARAPASLLERACAAWCAAGSDARLATLWFVAYARMLAREPPPAVEAAILARRGLLAGPGFAGADGPSLEEALAACGVLRAAHRALRPDAATRGYALAAARRLGVHLEREAPDAAAALRAVEVPERVLREVLSACRRAPAALLRDEGHPDGPAVAAWLAREAARLPREAVQRDLRAAYYEARLCPGDEEEFARRFPGDMAVARSVLHRLRPAALAAADGAMRRSAAELAAGGGGDPLAEEVARAAVLSLVALDPEGGRTWFASHYGPDAPLAPRVERLLGWYAVRPGAEAYPTLCDALAAWAAAAPHAVRRRWGWPEGYE